MDVLSRIQVKIDDLTEVDCVMEVFAFGGNQRSFFAHLHFSIIIHKATMLFIA